MAMAARVSLKLSQGFVNSLKYFHMKQILFTPCLTVGSNVYYMGETGPEIVCVAAIKYLDFGLEEYDCTDKSNILEEKAKVIDASTSKIHRLETWYGIIGDELYDVDESDCKWVREDELFTSKSALIDYFKTIVKKLK